MAVLADNNIFLKIDNVEVQAYFKSVTPSLSTAEHDASAGAGLDWSEIAPGLNKLSLQIEIEYDIAAVAAQIQHLATGQIVEIEYGPEGAVSGKPRHVQSFHLASVNGPGTKVDKTPVIFSITANSSGAPSVNMYAGGVYS